MMETQQGDPQIMSQRNGSTHEVIFDANDFNRNVLTNTGGSDGGGNQNSGSEQRHPAVAVANQAGQIVPVSGGGHAVMLNQTVTQTITPSVGNKDWAKPQTTIQLKQEPNQTSVPKIPSGVDKFKQTHNQHEDLRRRASYRKIYEEINPVENGQSKHAMIDSFVGGGPPTGSLDRAGPIQIQTEFSVPNVKTEIIPNPTPSTDSDDTEPDMKNHSPSNTTTNSNLPPQTIQIPAAPDNQTTSVLEVHVGNQTPAQGLPYPSAIQTPMSYTDMHPSQIQLKYASQAFHGFDHSDLDTSLTENIDQMTGPVALVEEAARKREVRLLKNREAARECRRKKKEYIKCLENRVQVLESQNKALIDELKNLKEMYQCNQP